MKMLSPLWAHVKAARAFLTLVVVASAAAFLYWKFATVQRDRNQLQAFATVACASTGVEFPASVDQVPDGKGRPRPVARLRGDLCRARIQQLVAFERDATKASNDALAGALERHANKSEADASAAAGYAAAAGAAARRMENAENEVQSDNRVEPDWFDALNGLAGLRRKD